MTSLYSQTVPVFTKYLRNMSVMLEKSRKFAEEKGMSPDEILGFRLIDNMRPIPYQVQSCSNTSKWLAVRVAGIENVFLEDNETTFEQLQARIERTIGILESLKPDCMDGMEEKEVRMETAIGTFQFTGSRYISEFAIPNFHFHLSTCYCIMRHLGVPLDAVDYLKDVFVKA